MALDRDGPSDKWLNFNEGCAREAKNMITVAIATTSPLIRASGTYKILLTYTSCVR